MKLTKSQHTKLFSGYDDPQLVGGVQGDAWFNAFILSGEYKSLPKGSTLEDIACAVNRFVYSDEGEHFQGFIDQVGPHVALLTTEILIHSKNYKLNLVPLIAGLPGGVMYAGRILIRVDGLPESGQDLAKRLRNDRLLRMKGFESIRFAQAEVEKDATGCAKACISLAKKLGRERKAVLLVA